MTNNKIDLTDNGELHLREASTNGKSAVKVKAPSALSADLTLTLPGSATGTAARPLMMTSAGVIAEANKEFDINGLTLPAGTEFIRIDASGNLTTTSGSGANDLDLAYDQGGAGNGRTITVDSGAVLLDGGADNILLDVNQTTAATTTVLKLTNSGTGNALLVTQDGDGVACKIDQNGEATALDVNATHTGSNNVVDIQNSGTGNALLVTQDGDGNGIEVVQTNSAATKSVLVVRNSGTGNAGFFRQDGDARAIVASKLSTGSANCVTIDNAGTGDALQLTQDGDGVALDINKTNTDASNCVTVDNESTGDALQITQNGAGVGIDLRQNADAVGMSIASTVGTGDVLLLNRTATASGGKSLHITQHQNGALIHLENSASSKSPTMIDIDNSGQGAAISIEDAHASKTLASVVINRSSSAGSCLTCIGDGGTFTVETEGRVEVPGLKFENGREQTIDANGEIDVLVSNAFRSYIKLQPASGNTDNLDSINSSIGFNDGMIVILSVHDAADTITVRHGQSPAGSGDPIFLSGGTNATLDHENDKLGLIYDSDANGGLGGWCQLWFSSNG